MLYNIRNLGKYVVVLKWPCLFGVTVWRFWFWSNQSLHNDASNSTSNIVMDIKVRTKEIQKVNKCMFGWYED